MKTIRIIVITFIVTAIVFFGISKVLKAGRDKSSQPQTVRIEDVQRGELVEIVSAPGQIEPRTKVDLSAKVSGRVVELPYKEGDFVTKGDPSANSPVPGSILIRLDSKDLESQLRSAQASRMAQAAQMEVEKARLSSQKATLESIEATLRQTERDYERQKQLLESHDISQSSLEQIQSRLEELKAQHQASIYSLNAAELNLAVLKYNLEAADARIEQAQDTLEYTIIRSPMDGVITRINAEVGEVVMTGTMNNPGTVIMQVADLSKMILVAEVDEANIGQLKVGQPAKVRVQAFWDQEFDGVVDTIALTHDMSLTRTKYFKTEILLMGDVTKLYSGLTADVDIETKKHSNIIKVPSQAVLGCKVDELPVDIRQNNPNVNPDKTEAMVVYRYIDGQAVATPVKAGPGDMIDIIILSGISEGDKIVVGPYKILESIKHGQKIRDEKEVKKDKPVKDAEESKTTAGKYPSG